MASKPAYERHLVESERPEMRFQVRRNQAQCVHERVLTRFVSVA